MNQQVFVTLPDAIHQKLEAWTETQDRSMPRHSLLLPLLNLIIWFVEAALKTAKEQEAFVPQTKRRSWRK